MPELLPIEAHERTIHQIFSNDYAFEIPPYQRPYAWEVEQARDLLGDLLEALDNTGGASGGVYFLGSIVLIKSPGVADAKVVDGQQRLTTLTILLSVLRDLTTNLDRRYERRAYIYQKGTPDLGTQDRFRLLLRPDDRPFFQRWVQDPDPEAAAPDPALHEGSRQRILENAAFYRAELAKLSEPRRDDLIRYVLQRCYLVVVAVPTQEAARRIFTVLNARGMDLTATDILKAEFLDGAKSAEAVLAKRWEAVEQALGRDAFVELFGHIRMMHERRKPQSALESAFANVVPQLKADPEGFMDKLLEPISEAYELLNDPETVTKHFGGPAGAAVRSLQRIDSKDWMPPALLKLWRRKPNDAAEVGQFLIDLERLAYFLFVTRVGVNDRMQRFAGVMDDVHPRPNTPKTGALQLSEAEKADLLLALDGPLYRKSRVCRPVLQRLDEALSTGGATYETIVSIEHVLPQTVDPDSAWAVAFPDDQVRADWTHRLANLVLLTRRINSRAYNWSFARKKTEYFATAEGASPFPLTQGVLATADWTLAHLQTRQSELLAMLSALWSLAPASPASTAAPVTSGAGAA